MSRFTSHRGAGSSPQPWEVQLVFSPSGLGLREVGAGARTLQKRPGHPCPHTHINAVLAWLPRWPSGAGGASRSHFLKWRNVIRQLHPHPLPLAGGGVPLVGPGVSLTEHPLLPVWRRARARPGARTPAPLRPSGLGSTPRLLAWAGGAASGLSPARNKGHIVSLWWRRSAGTGPCLVRRGSPCAHLRGVPASVEASRATARKLWGDKTVPAVPRGPGLPGSLADPGARRGAYSLAVQLNADLRATDPHPGRLPRRTQCTGVPRSPAPRSRSRWRPAAAQAGAGPGRGLRPWLHTRSERSRRGGSGLSSARRAGLVVGWTPVPAPLALTQAPHSAGPTWVGGGFCAALRLPAEPVRGKKETQWHFFGQPLS